MNRSLQDLWPPLTDFGFLKKKAELAFFETKSTFLFYLFNQNSFNVYISAYVDAFVVQRPLVLFNWSIFDCLSKQGFVNLARLQNVAILKSIFIIFKLFNTYTCLKYVAVHYFSFITNNLFHTKFRKKQMFSAHSRPIRNLEVTFYHTLLYKRKA